MSINRVPGLYIVNQPERHARDHALCIAQDALYMHNLGYDDNYRACGRCGQRMSDEVKLETSQGLGARASIFETYCIFSELI